MIARPQYVVTHWTGWPNTPSVKRARIGDFADWSIGSMIELSVHLVDCFRKMAASVLRGIAVPGTEGLTITRNWSVAAAGAEDAASTIATTARRVLDMTI